MEKCIKHIYRLQLEKSSVDHLLYAETLLRKSIDWLKKSRAGRITFGITRNMIGRVGKENDLKFRSSPGIGSHAKQKAALVYYGLHRFR